MSLLREIISQADESKLRFLLIGGLAVNAHGYYRDSADVDLLIPRADIEAWRGLLTARGYREDGGGTSFLQWHPPYGAAWPIDLMHVNEPTFEKMFAECLPSNLGDIAVRIPKLQHLIALKVHALKHSHAGRYLKDFMDVEGLIKANRLDVASQEMREIFQKYGTIELYEQIIRACS